MTIAEARRRYHQSRPASAQPEIDQLCALATNFTVAEPEPHMEPMMYRILWAFYGEAWVNFKAQYELPPKTASPIPSGTCAVYE